MESDRWRIEMLGGLRTREGERVVEHFRTRKAAALLAHLALYPNRVHPREQLIDLFWPDLEETDGRNNLRYSLSVLRRTLDTPELGTGPILLSDNTSVRLNPDAVITDVALFDAALKRQDYKSAVALYSGELLAGFYEEWVLPERRRLEVAYLRALNQLVVQHEAEGDPLTAAQYALRILAINPLEEESHLAVIRSYAAAGQTESARKQYQELSKVLREQLDMTPSLAAVEAMKRAEDERVIGNGKRVRSTWKRITDPPSSDTAIASSPSGNDVSPTLEPDPVQEAPQVPETIALMPRRFHAGRSIALASVCLVPLLAFLIAYFVRTPRSTMFQPTPPGKAQALPAEEIEAKLLLVETLQDKTDGKETPEENRTRQSRRLALCNELTEQAWNSWYGPDEEEWLMRLERIHTDLMAALRWAVENDPPGALQMTGALTRFWYVEDLVSEGQQWLQEALQTGPRLHTNVRARALVGAGWLTSEGDSHLNPIHLDLGGNHLKGRELCQEALTIYQENQDPWGIAHATRLLGLTYGAQLDGNKAIPCLEDAYRRFEAIEDKRGMALAQLCKGFDYNNWDSPRTSPRQCDERSFESFRRSHTLFQEIGNEWGIALTFDFMAKFANLLGDHESEHRFRTDYLKFTKQCESVRIERLWDVYSRAWARQDWKTVRRSLTLLAQLYLRRDDVPELIRLLDRFIVYYIQGEGKSRKATELLGAARTACETFHIDEFNRSLDASGDALRADLGELKFKHTVKICSGQSPAWAVNFAISP